MSPFVKWWVVWHVVAMVLLVAFVFAYQAVDPDEGWEFALLFGAFILFPKEWLVERMMGPRPKRQRRAGA